MNNVFAEVWELIKFMNWDDLNKIPSNLIKFINQNRNKNWKFEYNYKIDIDEQGIMEESKDLFSVIYYKYCCTDEQKRKLIKKWKENDNT